MIRAILLRKYKLPGMTYTLPVLVLSLGLLQCAALDDSGRLGGDADRVYGEQVGSNRSHNGARQPWSVKILSPFSYEPVERAELKVSVDVSALPLPCSIDVLLNGHKVVSYNLEPGPTARKGSWSWHPEERILQDLDGFNGLEVVVRQAVCARDAGRCRAAESRL